LAQNEASQKRDDRQEGDKAGEPRICQRVAVLCQLRPLPTLAGVTTMPWWAPLGGLVGAFAVVAGLLFVNKVGAGPFAGLTITANILMSLGIDKFGWFGMDIHPLNGWRMLGAALMVAGIALIARF
jgi:transporter family-2 protein